MTDASKLVLARTSGEALTLGDLKNLLNTLSEEELNNPALLWKIRNKSATIRAFRVREVYQMTEDHINPTGDGIEPVSTYEGEDISNEPVVVKQGSLIFNIS